VKGLATALQVFPAVHAVATVVVFSQIASTSPTNAIVAVDFAPVVPM
jgi:hypothetical protein